MLHRLSRVATQALERRPALVMVVLASLASVHLLTITISPTVWQDEVQIVDLGRSVISPDPTWSLGWTARQRPVAFVNYLGPVLQEAAYRALAPSIVGPRLSTLLGAVVAAYFMFLWLRSRSVTVGPALALAVVFLLDPVFVQGYRGARVDCWVMALVMAACVLVRRSADAAESGGEVSRRLVLPSALVVVAFFVWPSAIYLVPLIAAEAILVLTPRWVSGRVAWRWGLAVMGGALLGLALCLIPIADQLPAMIADTLVSRQSYYRPQSPWVYLPGAARDLVLSYQQSPFLPLAAVAAAFSRRNRVLAAATAIAAVSMLPTTVYVHRIVYLLPYLIGLVGEGWCVVNASRLRAWPAAGLAAAVLWVVGLSLVARPALALSARYARDPARLEEVAAQMPELRFERVFLEPWEFYYAGRQLGWKMVRPYGDIGSQANVALFAGLDYALLSEAESAKRREFLEGMGWHLAHQVTLPSAQATFLVRAPATPRRYDLYARRPLTSPTAPLAPR